MRISKYIDKNSYGGQTIEIALNTFFILLINETNAKSYNVEFKEKKIFGAKIRFSFISNLDLETTTIDAFNKIKQYFDNRDDVMWSTEQKNLQIEKAINHFRTYNYV